MSKCSLAKSNLNWLISNTTILPAPVNFARITCISPAGPAPNIAMSSPFWSLHLVRPLMQHANGSIREASSNVTSSGNFTSPPLIMFGSGTKICSDSPHGSILLF